MLTRPASGLTLPGTVLQDTVSKIQDPRAPVQYKRAKLRKLRDTLACTRVKLSAAQRRYKTDFNNKVRFRPVIVLRDFVYVERPSRPLSSTERGDLPSDVGGPSVKRLAKTERPFQVGSAKEITVVVDQDGVSNRVSIDLVTKMLRGPHDATVAAPTMERQQGYPNRRRNTWLTTWSPNGTPAAAASTRSVGTVTPQRTILGNPPRASRNPSSTASGVRGQLHATVKTAPEVPGADEMDPPTERPDAAAVKETLGQATSPPSGWIKLWHPSEPGLAPARPNRTGQVPAWK